MEHALLLLLLLVVAAVNAADIGQVTLTEEEKERCKKEIAALNETDVVWTVAATIHGYNMAVYGESDVISSSIVTRGSWGGSTPSSWLKKGMDRYKTVPSERRGCKSPPCQEHLFVDVGANVGWWTFQAAHMGYRVVAVEGAPPNVALIRLSMCLNPQLAANIKVYQGMLGMEHQNCVIAMPSKNQGDGWLQCRTGRSEWSTQEINALITNSKGFLKKAYRQPMVHLSKILDQAYDEDPTLPYTVALVKLDTEGSEYPILNGTMSYLKDKRFPTVVSGIWRQSIGGADNYVKFMMDKGFKLNLQIHLECDTPLDSSNIDKWMAKMPAIATLCASIDL